MSDETVQVAIFKSRVIPCPATELWALLRDFGSLVLWNPGVVAVDLSAGKHETGCIRDLHIHDGKLFREKLLNLDEKGMRLIYSIISCPMPVSDYVASIQVIPITATGQSLAIWQSDFRCRTEDRKKMDWYFGVSAYEEGLEGLEKVMIYANP